MDLDASFGHWLTLRRKALHLSRVDLASRVGCATVTLRKIEADERRPSQQIAEKLADHLNVTHQERTRFIKAARGELRVEQLSTPSQLADRPALAPGAPLRTKLPIPPTPLIGREREVAQVCTLLRDAGRAPAHPDRPGRHRQDPPGAPGRRPSCSTTFADGVCFVDLAPISDADLVSARIAQTLGVREAAGQPLLDQLQDYSARQAACCCCSTTSSRWSTRRRWCRAAGGVRRG